MNQPANTDSVAVVVLDSDGNYLTANERAQEIHGRSEKELREMSITDTHGDIGIEEIRKIDQILDGEKVSHSDSIVSADGTIYHYDAEAESVTIDGESCIRVEQTVTSKESADNSGIEIDQTTGESVMENIAAKISQETTANIRVDTSNGEMPLSSILKDVSRGHREVEDYKQGALAMYEALDARLKEAEKKNESDDVERAINEVKESAWKLYKRIQYGDENMD